MWNRITYKRRQNKENVKTDEKHQNGDILLIHGSLLCQNYYFLLEVECISPPCTTAKTIFKNEYVERKALFSYTVPYPPPPHAPHTRIY